MKTKLTFTLCLLLTTFPSIAKAGIVVNPGFETGTFFGWTVVDSSASTFVTSAAATPGYSPNSGTYFAALGATGSLGTVSQTLNTVTGTTYTLDYFLANDGSTPNEFKVTWNGKVLSDQVNITAQPYKEYKFQVLASSSSSVLSFSERSDNGFLSLDDISVTPAITVPEPTSMIPLGIGITMLAGYSVYRGNRDQ